MIDFSNFTFKDAKLETILKGEQIYLADKVKKIDDKNYVVCGGQEYEVSLVPEEKTIQCSCQGYFHYLYCKHSIALAVYLNGGKRI